MYILSDRYMYFSKLHDTHITVYITVSVFQPCMYICIRDTVVLQKNVFFCINSFFEHVRILSGRLF